MTWTLWRLATVEWKIQRLASQNPAISGAQKCPTSESTYGFIVPRAIVTSEP